jgi:hypothetical protein
MQIEKNRYPPGWQIFRDSSSMNFNNTAILAFLQPYRPDRSGPATRLFACNIFEIAAILDEARQMLTRTTVAAYDAPRRQ